MKSLLVSLILLSGAMAQAKLVCSVQNFFWSKAEVDSAGPNKVIFTVLAGNGMGGDADVGKRAILQLVGTAHPNGKTFFHYHGMFEAGASQKSLSFFLSEDGRTLTQMLALNPLNWSCVPQ